MGADDKCTDNHSYKDALEVSYTKQLCSRQVENQAMFRTFATYGPIRLTKVKTTEKKTSMILPSIKFRSNYDISNKTRLCSLDFPMPFSQSMHICDILRRTLHMPQQLQSTQAHTPTKHKLFPSYLHNSTSCNGEIVASIKDKRGREKTEN